MPVRIYDIAKKLGIESKEVLAKAKALGITTAKVPSSSLDKITAEFLLQEIGGKLVAPGIPPTPPAGEPLILVTPPAQEEAPAPSQAVPALGAPKAAAGIELITARVQPEAVTSPAVPAIAEVKVEPAAEVAPPPSAPKVPQLGE